MFYLLTLFFPKCLRWTDLLWWRQWLHNYEVAVEKTQFLLLHQTLSAAQEPEKEESELEIWDTVEMSLCAMNTALCHEYLVVFPVECILGHFLS